MAGIYFPEGFFPTTLSSDINGSTTTIPLTAVPSRVTSGYMVIEPTSGTKREVIHFTSVGVSSVTTADDTTDASDAAGRGCTGSVTTGANTTHIQGATVLIAATEQYWARMRSALGNILDLSTGDIDYTELATALYAADAGSNDTYAITLSPVPSAYADLTGLPISFKANTANTGAATLNVNSLGAKTIKKSHDQDLSDNDIEAGQIVTVVYDGTNFQMQSQLANATGGLATDSLWNAAGDIAYATGDNAGAVLPAGATGSVLRIVSGLPAWVAPRIKIGTFTRTQDAADGNQAITGVGFTPKAVLFFGGVSGAESRSIGVDDGTNHYVDVVATTAAHVNDTSYSIKTLDNGSWDEKGRITSMDSDGFTIAWTKGGSPVSATITIFYLALG